jgi:hypothetical protein
MKIGLVSNPDITLLTPAPAGTNEAPTDVAKDQQQQQTCSQSSPDLISI